MINEITENLRIGLFGTCGDSLWRNDFIKKYNELNIPFFNPQVSDWKPEYAENEAFHLSNDKIILFPITEETYATGSLAEVGFSILNAIKLNDKRNFVIYITDFLSPELKDESLRRESLRARILVKQHLKQINIGNVYEADSLSNLLDISLCLYESEKIKQQISKYSLGLK